MRPVMLFLVGLFLGGGVYALGQSLLMPVDEPPPSSLSPMAVDTDALSSSALDKVVVRLDRIERRLDDIATAPPVAPERPRLKGSADAERTAVESTKPGAVAIDPDALAEALETIEARKWAELSDEEVKSAAQRLAKSGNLPGAREALERLLARELEPEAKSEVLTQLGMAQRAGKDFEGSATTLREAIRVVGLDSPQGVQAGMQLAWTLSKTEDYNSALRVAEDVIRVPSSAGQLRTNMRWGVGVLSALEGDSARARAEFETVIRDAEENPGLVKLAEDARRRLEELR